MQEFANPNSLHLLSTYLSDNVQMVGIKFMNIVFFILKTLKEIEKYIKVVFFSAFANSSNILWMKNLELLF